MRKDLWMMQHNDITTRTKGQHLSLSERIEIQTQKRLGYSNRRIAKNLNRSHSTINDEIKRGTATQKKIVNGYTYTTELYYAETGQIVYEKHRLKCRPQAKLFKVQAFIDYATHKISEDKWSPDIVVGRVLKEGHFERSEIVCAKTLYNYIDKGLIKDLNNLNLWLKLRRKTKSKKARDHRRVLGQSIDLRPQEINDRSTFGHWEIDTVIGKKKKDEPVLLTMTERLTRYQIILKIKGKYEEAVNEGLKQLNLDHPHFPQLFKSITSDNGSEFAGLTELINDLSDVYFAHPYSSWERGTNERHNGLIRRSIPKGKSLKTIPESIIDQVVHSMNHLPRKILNYQTPTESILFHFNQIQTT